MANEIGSSPARGRPMMPIEDAEAALSQIAGKRIELPPNAVARTSPLSCPACGAHQLMWGCDERQTREREEIHPLVWHETAWMADSFICEVCWAGWVEPDDPTVITWVRPYWID